MSPNRAALVRAQCILSLLLASIAFPARAATLDHIRQTKTLRCGINQETPEYSTSDDHGARQAFDADICKAVAVAILGPNARTTLVPYPDDVAAMAALPTGKVDLVPTLTLDLKHSANTGIVFSPPLLYDGVGFLVPLSASLTHAAELSDRKVCFLAETEVEAALRAWFSRQPTQPNLTFVPFPFQEEGEMEAAFVTRNCAAITADVSQLAYDRLGFKSMAKNFEILPEVIAKDPLAPTYTLDDPQWATIVNWTVEALIQAEESGVTQANLAEMKMKKSDDVVIRRLLGLQRGYGQLIGLDDAWAARVIEAVGNYGEIFERDLGSGSVMKLPRGLNNLWTQGGLMYALPIR